jgi:fusion and transport protein UGO1
MDSHDDSYSPFAKMSRDQPNPLRPYYIPPSIGNSTSSQTAPGNISAAGYTSNSRPSPSGSPNKGFKDLFSDLDYGDYLPQGSPSTAQLVKEKLDQAIWNYTSVLLAQPFEVAKVVLQCHDAGAMIIEDSDGLERRQLGRAHDYSFSDSESDSEAPSYFMPTTPDETPSHRPRRRDISRTHSTASTNPTSTQSSTLRLLQSDSVLEVIAQLWNKEGAFGVWKGTNSTFIYGVLLKTIETWTRSCLSAILDIPDPMLFNAALGIKSYNGPSILDSPSPIASLSVVVVAAAVAGCLLAPVDLVRTK